MKTKRIIASIIPLVLLASVVMPVASIPSAHATSVDIPIESNPLVHATSVDMSVAPDSMSKKTAPVEIIDDRTESSKTYIVGYKGNGMPIYQLNASMGAIHYKDDYTSGSEPWKDIDLTWEDNKITRAPYELTHEGNKLTLRNKRTNEISTIELLDIGGKDIPNIPSMNWEKSNGLNKTSGIAKRYSIALDTDIEVVVKNDRIEFTRILKSDRAPREARFRVSGNFTVKARDKDGELFVESSLVNGILTETLKPERPVKYPVRIDPTWIVLASTDDCYRNLALGGFSLVANSQYAGANGATTQYGSGMRFNSIGIPQASVITGANITFVSTSALNGVGCNTTICAEDVDNAVTFADNATVFDNRYANQTTANVTWDGMGTWSVDEESSNTTSPDITTVIQEVIDRGGWVAGNSMVLFWHDFDNRSTAAANNYRRAYSYDNDPTKAPELLITFTGSLTDAYWVGDGGNWSDDDNHWAPVSGGIPGDGNIPGATTNVHFDANSFTVGGQTVVKNVPSYSLDMDWTGATNSPTLTIGGTHHNVYGDVTFINAMTVSSAGTTFGFLFSSAGVQVLTTNGCTITSGILYVYSATATLSLADNLVAPTTVISIFSGGTLLSNNNDITCYQIDDGGSAPAKTITLGTSTINIGNGGWSITGAGAVTVTANTATINIAGTGALVGSSVNYNGADFNLNGTAHTVSGSFTCADLTRNGTVTKTDSVTFTSGDTVSCTTFAMIGNSAINRLLVQSSTLGTAATINATAFTGTNAADFMDITSTNVIDLSAGGLNPPAFAGDCGGNSNITFTAAATQTWDGTTGNWDNVAKWTSRVPIPQDTVLAGGAGNTITVNMPRIGGSITFTGTPTVSLSNNIYNFGSLTMVSGMTYTHNNKINFLRGRGVYTLTSAGKSFYYLQVAVPGGTLTLQDTLTVIHALSYSIGTFDLNDQNMNITTNAFYSQCTTTRLLSLGNGTITISGTAAALIKWDVNATNLTLNAEGSTIVLTNAGVNAQTFAGAGLTYNNVTIEGAGNYSLQINGSNTFNTLTVDRSIAAKTILFTDGTNQTMADFVCADSGVTVVTLNGTGAGGWDIAKTGGGWVVVDYMDITSSNATPLLTWYAHNHSTDGGGNSGWVFATPPPTVVTVGAVAANTTSISFLGSGNITATFVNASVRGFEYGTISGVYTANVTSTGSYGVGEFQLTASGLNPNTLYYFRALAVTLGMVGYGAEDNVTTLIGISNLRGVPTSDSIILTWEPPPGSSNTTIAYRTDTYPATGADGIIIYTGSGFQTTVTDLTPGQVYYFSAWNGVVGASSNTTTHLVMSTLGVDIPSGAPIVPTNPFPVPTLPAEIDQPASIPPGSDFTPFTAIINYFVTAPGGLGAPIGNVWQMLALYGVVMVGAGTYIKFRNFFIAFFVLFCLTVFCYSLELVQGWLIPIEIIIGLGAWAIDKYFQ